MIRGFDVVQKISGTAVDDKSRPINPVVISSCGELELRHNVTISIREPYIIRSSRNILIVAREANEEKKLKKKQRHRSHSRSPSHSRSHSGSRERRKRKYRKRDTCDDFGAAHQDELEEGKRKETEEEYDARLEREERERIATRQREELELRRSRYQQAPASEGVRFKGRQQHLVCVFGKEVKSFYTGRGRMRYVDPEVRRTHGWDN